MNLIDLTIVISYFLLIIFIGYITGKKEKNSFDYFLAGRKMPWWAVMISIYATSLSALTFVGVPGAVIAKGGDFHYLQLGLGDLVGRILVSVILLKAYYKYKVETVYQLLEKRFGGKTQLTGTLFFIVTRLLASGVRLAGCAIALSVIFNIPLNISILLISIVALIYTTIGGIKAVIWTDLVQFVLFISAALIAIAIVIYFLPNNFKDFFDIGNQFDKFKIFHISLNNTSPDFIFNFSNPKSLFAGFLFGAFTTMAVLGTDQDLVQRMLTCKNIKQSQKALILSAILNFPVTLLFLSVGAAIFIYYQVFTPDSIVSGYLDKRPDFVFPYFIKTVISPGFRGLLIAGLLAAAMSSIDSAINALSSTFYLDIFKKFFDKKIKINSVKISRIFSIIFTVLLALSAIMFSNTQSILWLGFKIFGYSYGAMLGIFLSATIFKKRGNDIANVFLMISSVFIVIFLTNDSIGFLQPIRCFILKPLNITQIAWPWAIIIGTIYTFSTSILFNKQGK